MASPVFTLSSARQKLFSLVQSVMDHVQQVVAPMISARMPIVTVLLLTAIVGATSSAKAAIPAPPFTLSSPDARWREHVPDIYIANAFGCAGGNTSPPLEWHNPPPGTKSFVLTLFDRDERSTPSGWWHWVVYDLPPGTRSLPAGAGAAHSALLPAGTKQGRTDLGNAAYHGPCPAKGDPPHRYVLTLYALSVETLPVDPESSGAMVTSTAQDSLLGKAVLLVHYGRP